MSRSRKSIEPVGNFVILVVLVHVILGGGLWWWLRSAPDGATKAADSEPKVVWVNPADAVNQLPPVVEAPASAPVLAQVTPSPMPKVEAPAPAEEEDVVPKAIAIDPAKAAELMAKANAMASAPAPEPKVESKPEPDPKPAAKVEPPPPAPEPEPKPMVKADPPAPVPEPPVAAAPTAPAGSAPIMTTPPVPRPGETVDPLPPPLPKVEPMPATAAKTTPDEELPPPPLPATAGSRFLTVSHPKAAKAKPQASPSVGLLDIAALDASTSGTLASDRVEAVDKATKAAFNRLWSPPDPATLSPDHRDVSLQLTVNREGRILKYKPVKNSGSSELDMSVLDAANRLDKIDAPLPADYPHDIYEFTVNFHVE